MQDGAVETELAGQEVLGQIGPDKGPCSFREERSDRCVPAFGVRALNLLVGSPQAPLGTAATAVGIGTLRLSKRKSNAAAAPRAILRACLRVGAPATLSNQCSWLWLVTVPPSNKPLRAALRARPTAGGH